VIWWMSSWGKNEKGEDKRENVKERKKEAI
jgi:hypothetical protein